MQPFGKVRRARRFLTGAFCHAGDTVPRGALRAGSGRSGTARGTIHAIGAAAAPDFPGVGTVMAAADAPARGAPPPVDRIAAPNRDGDRVAPNRDGERVARPARPVQAARRVRFAGKPNAPARDATGTARRGSAGRPAPVDLGPAGPALHGGAAESAACDLRPGDGVGIETAPAASRHRATVDMAVRRVASGPMATRAGRAETDAGRRPVSFGGQGGRVPKRESLRRLGPAFGQVLGTIPGPGDELGPGDVAPDYPGVALAARRLGRPVARGVETLTGPAMPGEDAARRIPARDETRPLPGTGNRGPVPPIWADLFARAPTGICTRRAASLRMRETHTDIAPTDADRGAGRPVAGLAPKRAVDRAARDRANDGRRAGQ